jgi:hypothetical protein
MLWDVMCAGIAGVITAILPRGGKLCAIAGGTIFGVAFLLIGSMMAMVFGIGAWVALGASAVAIVAGVLAGRAHT